MKFGVVTFPGSNCDEDMVYVLETIMGQQVERLWHKDTSLKGVDFVVLPGGFSYGDYLRSGAIAKLSPIMSEVMNHAGKGGYVMGICNGFQILVEAGMLPGALMRNQSLKFVCKEIKLEVVNADTDFTRAYAKGQIIRCPVAHHDGNYFADAETLKTIEGNGQVVFRYTDGTNPNGSMNDIAGVINARGNVLGMMPHPENLIEAAHGGNDGRGIFASALDVIAA